MNFCVSFLHLRVTEKIEKPIVEVKPNTKPINDFSPVFPSAIIMIPTVAIIIDIHTLKEIFSLKNKNANNAVKKGSYMTGMVNGKLVLDDNGDPRHLKTIGVVR